MTGVLPQWAPLPAHLPPAPERGVSEVPQPRDSSGWGSAAQLVLKEGVLPEVAFLLQVQGHGEQHVAALAGGEAQQLLHQPAPLLWGTRGSVGHGRPACPSPSVQTAASTASPQSGGPHLPAWRWRGRSPGRTGAAWAGPCGRAAAGAGGRCGAAAAPCGYSTAR